jgi:hypothetical protein
MSDGDTIEYAQAVLCAAGVNSLLSPSGRSLLVLTSTDHAKLAAEITLCQMSHSLAASALYPVIIPEPRRAEVAEYIRRANGFECCGAFKSDRDGGQLAFTVTAFFEEEGFSDELLCRVAWVALTRLDVHLDALGRIIYAGATSDEALDLVYRFDVNDVIDEINGDL